MGEKASYSDNHLKCFTQRCEKEIIFVERWKSLVQSIKSDDSIFAYSNAFQVSNFLNLECLEIFLDSLINRARQEILQKNLFNLSYFLCVFCCDILRDPVTLKCGHTFSKKCVLSRTKTGFFDCLKCAKTYSHSYLSELKRNVVISSLIENFWKKSQENEYLEIQKEGLHNMCDQYTRLLTNEADSFQNLDMCRIFLENPVAKDFLREGDVLVKLKRYKEAVLFYLMCSVFDPQAVQSRDKAIKYFHKCLLRNASFQNGYTLNSSNCTEKCYRIMQLKESEEKRNLYLLLNKFCKDVENLSGEKMIIFRMASLRLNKQEFECPLCMRILWEPITTVCGHTFCRICLDRCLDHQPACPLCKKSLISSLAERVRSIDEFADLVITQAFPKEYAGRKALYLQEMEKLFNAGKDRDHVIPLFVCTIAFPTVPCPLHIFEPRYRLMIRQCMESGSRKFGMCAFIDNNISDYGTVLEIKDVRYFPDGRSVVDTVGSRRFRILRKGEQDGYHTGAVEYLKDEESLFLADLKKQHDRLYKIAQGWVMRLPQYTRHQILQHFGPMPRIQPNCLSSSDGPAWFWWMLAILPIEPKSQILILSMTSLSERLRTLEKILLHLTTIS